MWKVEVYRQIGGLPNIAVDQLLGVDQIENLDNEFNWAIIGSLTENRHNIYAVVYDKAGNISSQTSRQIIVLPDPFRVSSVIDWTIGEVGAVTIGACN